MKYEKNVFNVGLLLGLFEGRWTNQSERYEKGILFFSKSPKEIFKLSVADELIMKMVEYTHRKAEQKIDG
jgi:hypothetical protein